MGVKDVAVDVADAGVLDALEGRLDVGLVALGKIMLFQAVVIGMSVVFQRASHDDVVWVGCGTTVRAEGAVEGTDKNT